MDLESIVRIYKLKIRPKAQAELDWFRDQPSLAAAIRTAALALNRKQKRYSHQRRIKRSAIQEALSRLQRLETKIRNCSNFRTLFSLINEELAEVPGIGELYIYDTVLRIGAKLDVFPEKVYLHAGTRTGARKLGLNTAKSALKMSSFPPPLRTLEPQEVEDVLCIFKDKLRHGARSLDSGLLSRSWCG